MQLLAYSITEFIKMFQELWGITGVGQLQLLSPFSGLTLAVLLLHEPVTWTMIAVPSLVVLCVAGAERFACEAYTRARPSLSLGRHLPENHDDRIAIMAAGPHQ
jgi:hypothetical protein